MHKFLTGTVRKSKLAPRQVQFIASTSDVDRDGDRILPDGIDLTNYVKNSVLLRDHDPTRPVARASGLRVIGKALQGYGNFPPEGASACADETYNLIIAGVLSGVSIGFMPIESEPLTGGGRLYTAIELLECSFVAIPSNSLALITDKRYGAAATERRRSYTRYEREADIAALRDAAPSAPPAMSQRSAYLFHEQQRVLDMSARCYAHDPKIRRAERAREIAKLRG
jgi:HK97 family phage prohead protease